MVIKKRNLKDYIFLQLYFRHVHLHSRVELLVPYQKMAASSTKSNLDLLILAGKYGGFNVYRKILGLLCKSLETFKRFHSFDAIFYELLPTQPGSGDKISQ